MAERATCTTTRKVVESAGSLPGSVSDTPGQGASHEMRIRQRSLQSTGVGLGAASANSSSSPTTMEPPSYFTRSSPPPILRYGHACESSGEIQAISPELDSPRLCLFFPRLRNGFHFPPLRFAIAAYLSDPFRAFR